MSESKYIIDNEILMKEWNWNKNINWQPENLTIGSKEKVWWKCEKGHEWQAVIYSRVAGNKCPYCVGKKILKGFNDIFTLHPNWKKYWDYEVNNELHIDPYVLGSKSHTKVNWICSNCGIKFQRALSKTKDIVLCINCSIKLGAKKQVRTKINQNDTLLNAYPEISKEWNYEKNANLKPDDISVSSNQRVWWKCEKGHEWQASINNRTYNKRTCPYCTNQKILKGYNDLDFLYPNIAKEWNYEKNKKTPYEIGPGTAKKYWWKCKLGHEWQASPVQRVREGTGCPICSSERKISIPEKTVLFYIQKYYKDKIISNYRSEIIDNKELDIYLPNKLIGIEYDGVYFHKNRSRDLLKDDLCAKIGIQVLHISECRDKNKIDENYIYYNVNKESNLEWAINQLLYILFGKNRNYDINIARDRIKIYDLIDYYEKEQSLQTNYPELTKEWNYQKNGKLKPEFVSYGSYKKVWWKCEKGHEWQAVIYSRVAGAGCPYCAGQKPLKGFNDLETVYPNIAKEWNYEKNGNLKPDAITNKSNKKVWWKCEKGHEWQATVNIRTVKNHNCPYCANQKLLVGYNDLLTINPLLAKEWNYKRNGNLKPEQFFPNAHKKVWWTCPKGHEWEAAIGDRNTGNGCPYCANQKLLVGYNDLHTKNPKLVKEWNYKRNGNLKPEQFFPNAHKKVWWTCPKGHEYEAYILDRNRNNSGCPICCNKLIVKGINDLKTLNPTLAKYWNYKKNGNLTPDKVSSHSKKRVWWICPICNNEWDGSIADVAKKKYICSKCKK